MLIFNTRHGSHISKYQNHNIMHSNVRLSENSLFLCTTYYSHWSLLNKVYHKLENYFQCAYKIVAAILHQCKRKTCCILQISLKKIFFIFLWIMFQIDGLPIQERRNQLSYFLFWREKFWQTFSQTSNLFST